MSSKGIGSTEEIADELADVDEVADGATEDAVTDDDSGDDAVADVDETASAPRTYQIRRWVCWLAAALVLILGAAAGVLGWRVYTDHARQVNAARALDAARNYAVTLTTTEQNNIDQNFTAIIDGATGEFKDAYVKAGARMRKSLIDNKVNTTGTVIDSAVANDRGDEVDVLLAVKQVVTSGPAPKAQTDFISVSMTMRKVDNRWLAAKVRLAGADGTDAK